MIWLIVPIPLLALLLWGIIRKVKGLAEDEEFGENFAIGFGATFLGLTLLVLFAWTLGNGAGLANWQAFYEANSQNYATTVDQTASYLSEEKFIEQALIPVEGSVEKLQLAGYVSDRIKEWRDAVNGYNAAIARMQYYDKNIFTGVMVPDEVQEMKLLIIK